MATSELSKESPGTPRRRSRRRRLLLCAALVLASQAGPAGAVRAQDTASLSSAGSMPGADPQRSYAYSAAGPTRTPTQMVWQSPKFFKITYVASEPYFRSSPFMYYSEFSFATYFDFSDPVLAGKTLLVSINIGHAYLAALDAQTGTGKWRLTFKENWLSDPAAAGGVVYFTARDNWVRAVELETGRDLWRHKEKGKDMALNPSPVVERGVLLFATTDGIVHALRLENREKLWSFKAKSAVSAYALVEDTLVVGCAKGSVHALDMQTGREKWQFAAEGGVHTLALGRDAAYFRTVKGRLHGVALADGRQRWALDLGGPVQSLYPVSTVQVGSTLALRDGALFFSGAESRDIYLYAVDAARGAQLWKSAIEAPTRSPVVAGGLVYAPAIGVLYAFDARTGEERFKVEHREQLKGKRRDGKERVRSHVISSPVFLDGNMIFVGDDGLAYAMR